MIDLLPDDDQQAMEESIAQILAAEAPLSRLRGERDGDARLIDMLTELGWIGLGVDPGQGGLGAGAAEEVLLMRSAGRHLVGPSLFATMLAARLCAACGAGDLASDLVAGRRRAALCLPDRRDPGTGLRLDHRPGDLTLLVGEGGVALYDAPAADDGDRRAIDDSIALDRVSLGPASLLAEGGEDVAMRATLWFAGLLVGLAEATRDMASEYAKVRVQFGQPIGAFQAIKHRCADMALRCEAGWTQTVFAALAVDGGRSDAGFQVAAARLIAGDAALLNARANIQVHGGIGFTEECDAQLFVRRAQIWLEASGGTRRHQRALLAAELPAFGAPGGEGRA